MKETNLSLPPHSSNFFCPITLELNGQSAGREDRRQGQKEDTRDVYLVDRRDTWTSIEVVALISI